MRKKLRNNLKQSLLVDVGIEIAKRSGVAQASKYLAAMNVPIKVARRVLLTSRIRSKL
jgi:hypothetical protein